MPTYETPGVYYERVDAAAPGISALRTDIAGFVGIATRGPLNTPVPIQSWRQFQAYFGDFTGAGYLAYSVRAFFENGGSRCWVVRVSSLIASSAEAILLEDTIFAKPVWKIVAFSPGVWGNGLDFSLRETHVAQTLTLAEGSDAAGSAVATIHGFRRGTHVRLTQDGKPTIWKVVSDVDPIEKRLLWVHPKPESRLPYDSPLTGFNLKLPILIESVEYTLLAREAGKLNRIVEGLSLVPEHPKYGPALLPALLTAQAQATQRNFPAAPEPIVVQELRELAALPVTGIAPLRFDPETFTPLIGGADGLAMLGVFDFIGEEINPLNSDVTREQKRRGLRALEAVDEVSILAVPDILIRPIPPTVLAPRPVCVPNPCLPMPPASAPAPLPEVGDLPPVFNETQIFQVQSAMLQQCEKLKDRFALIDPPYSAAQSDALGVGAAQGWRSRFDSKYAAFYYPWIRVVDPLRDTRALTRDIPPSGHVAGQYAQTDLHVGVHKAPANSPLNWSQDVTAPVDDATHGLLNMLGINAIRALPGRGIRIFGARTVSSDSDWKYVNVRRLLMMVEKAIDVAIQWSVFEPNDFKTRARLQLTLMSFLTALWQQGALMGDTPREAFFVRCDDGNNPASERDQGRMLAEVGVAPSQPFEFVILRVGRVDNAFEITEQR